VTDVRSGKLVAHATGKHLNEGFTISAPTTFSARVFRVSAAG
jgi:hypothetical protein